MKCYRCGYNGKLSEVGEMGNERYLCNACASELCWRAMRFGLLLGAVAMLGWCLFCVFLQQPR